MNESQLVAPCCARCTHTASTPCPDLIACIERGPQCHDDDACRGLRAARIARARRGGDGMVLFVGAGTCGRANGALAVIDAIEAFLERRGLHVPVCRRAAWATASARCSWTSSRRRARACRYCDLSPREHRGVPARRVRRGRAAQPLAAGPLRRRERRVRGRDAAGRHAVLRAPDQGGAAAAAAWSTLHRWTRRWPPAPSAPPPGRSPP